MGCLTDRHIGIPELWHFDQNVSYISLPWNVNMSHTPEDRHFDQNIVSCMSLPQNVHLSTCQYVIHPRRSTLRPKCFLHVTASKWWSVNMSHILNGWHFDQNVSYISLPQNVNLFTCHTSHKVNTLIRMCPRYHCLELSTCGKYHKPKTLTSL